MSRKVTYCAGRVLANGNLCVICCKLSQLWTMTDKLCSRQPTDGLSSRSLQVRAMHELRYDRAAAHDLGVKHSPCMCSYGGGGDLIEPHS